MKNFPTSNNTYTKEDIDNIQVGDFIPNCFGKMSEVVEIYHKGEDVNGKKFACTYLKFTSNSTINESIKEDEKPFYTKSYPII